MFVVKIRNKEELLDVRHYNIFQNILCDIANKNIFENIPEELEETLGRPEIYCFSVGKKDGIEIADDFEFRYENGITLYIGEPWIVDN